MWLSKVKCKTGVWIDCYVGNIRYRSWWSSPPLSSDHVDIKYLKDRYSCITTEKRANEFKRLFKELMRGAE